MNQFHIILLISLITLSLQFNLRIIQQTTPCYGVSIDAGSSSTKIMIYEWECLRYSEIPKVSITKQTYTKTLKDQRLADYKDKLNELNTFFKLIFTEADKIITTPEKKKKTIIVLGATAGMRLIDESSQKQIIDQCIKLLSDPNFNQYYFPNNLSEQSEWAKVITGQQEGAFLWMSVNLELNRLSKYVNEDKNTVAVIDVGGASTQIAFSPDEKTEESRQNDFDLFIPRYNYYHLYSISYLGYGNDQARQAVLKSFSVDKNKIQSPCHFNGFDGQTDGLNVQGTGDFEKCSNNIIEYLNINKQKCKYPSSQECSIQNQYQALLNKNMPIYAVSSVQRSAQFLEFTANFKLNDFLQKLKQLYSLNWNQAITKYTKEDQKYLMNNMFMATYIYQLLKNGYNINDDTSIDISLNDLGWDKSNLLQKLSSLQCNVTSDLCFKAPYQIKQ